MNHQEKPDSSIMSNRKFFLLLASPVLLPLAMAPVLLFGMLLLCGWLFVAMVFFSGAAAAAAGAVGIAGAVANAANGTGAVLLLLSVGLAALGAVYPVLVLAVEFGRGYRQFSRVFLAKAKELIRKAREWL